MPQFPYLVLQAPLSGMFSLLNCGMTTLPLLPVVGLGLQLLYTFEFALH